MKRIYFLLLLIICSYSSQAQNYPITANLQLIPPYSVFLSDYTTSNADNLRVMLLFNDQFKDNIDIKLRFRIEGSGIKIQTDPNYRPAPYTLTKGVAEQLSGFDFTGYFDANSLVFQGMSKDQFRRRAALPDGYYRFCVQAFDYQTGVALSDEVCTAAWIVNNDPPRINQPTCGLKVKIQDPQYLLFSWLPMHTGSPNSAFSTEYTFQLVQIMPKGRNPNDAMLSGITIYEQTTTAPQILYTSSEPPLMAGEQYAWRVQAKDALGRDLFKNNGYSEVCWFDYGNSCEPPENVASFVEGAQRATITWDASPATNQYKVEFREFNSENKNWYEVTTVNTRQTLSSLRPNTTYEYRIRNQCGVKYSEYAKADTFRTRPIAQTTMLTCGQQPGKEPIDSLKKLPTLGRGDEVTIQDFTMTILEATGGNGRFTGKGLIRVKLLNTTLGTEFTKIGINDQMQVFDGSVRVSGASLTLLPPDVFIKVTDTYNEIISIGNEIDNGLGTTTELIDKGTVLLDKANTLYEDLNKAGGVENSADKVKDGSTNIKGGVEALKDGDTTKGKGLIGKGVELINQAVNGIGEAATAMGEGADKAKDYFVKILNEIKDSNIKGVGAYKDTISSGNASITEASSTNKNRRDQVVIGNHSTIAMGESVEASSANDFSTLSSTQLEVLKKNPEFKKYIEADVKNRKIRRAINESLKYIMAANYFLKDVNLQALVSDYSNDMKALGKDIIEVAKDGQDPKIEEKIREFIEAKIKTLINNK